jgi:hypothetical protein
MGRAANAKPKSKELSLVPASLTPNRITLTSAPFTISAMPSLSRGSPSAEPELVGPLPVLMFSTVGYI